MAVYWQFIYLFKTAREREREVMEGNGSGISTGSRLKNDIKYDFTVTTFLDLGGREWKG